MHFLTLSAFLAVCGSSVCLLLAERTKRLIDGIDANAKFAAFTCETILYFSNRQPARCSGALVEIDGTIAVLSCSHCFVLPNATHDHDFSRWVDESASNDYNLYRPQLGSSIYVRCGSGSIAGAQLQLELPKTVIKLHKNYGPSADASLAFSALFDIALFTVPADRIQNSWKWSPWTVHAPFIPEEGRKCTVISYGSTIAGDEKMANRPNEGERQVIHPDLCRVQSIICLGRPEESATSSQFDLQSGDSGAPCICQRREGSRTRKLVGIVSSVRAGRTATGQPTSGISAVVPLYNPDIWKFVTLASAATDSQDSI